MIFEDFTQFSLPVFLALAGLTVAMALAFMRMAKGPTAADRVTAMDAMSNIVVGFIAVYAIASDEIFLVDAAMALAIVTFLAAVGFTRYLEWGKRQDRP
jgi:multicomponent Na+:H+ antiporter subunit F